MVDDPNPPEPAPKPAGEAGGKADAAEPKDPILKAAGADSGTPLYQDIRIFVGALVGLAAATVAVYYFERGSVYFSFLLAATMAFGITGILGGRGYFKNSRGSIGGAAAILLTIFGSFEGVRYAQNADELEIAKEELATKTGEVETLSDEVSGLKTKVADLEERLGLRDAEVAAMTSKLETALSENTELKTAGETIALELAEAHARVAAFQNFASDLEIRVYCKEAPHTQQIFLVSEPRDPFSNRSPKPTGMPALLELKGGNVRTIHLHVAGYRPPGYITPPQTRFGRSNDRQMLPQTDPAFTVHTRWGVFDSETARLQKTEIRIEVHDYNALQRCDDREVAGR
jgi:hypothetical protein